MAITNEMLDELIGNAKTQEDVFGKDGLLNQWHYLKPQYFLILRLCRLVNLVINR